MSTGPFLCLVVWLLSVCLEACLSIYLSVYFSVCLFVYLPVCLCRSLSVFATTRYPTAPFQCLFSCIRSMIAMNEIEHDSTEMPEEQIIEHLSTAMEGVTDQMIDQLAKRFKS